ncbi:glycosyltransferase family 39 protein [Streptacidiphilus sp. N1-10]|uniref:Glycosyltransferase family 39 protein n=1 Tax=Streptacidiphilus jeojiensis TaxID=3229225 RepID=A0ABV6XTQ0_9ACTN
MPTPTTARSESRWARTALWAVPTLVSFLIGVFHSSRPELWRDELASVSASGRSLGQLFDLLGNTDASTGFYYLVLHFWTAAFGDSLTLLRMPSALAMAGAACCVALTGRLLFGRWAGLGGGLLFALVPGISRYGQETRAYAFVVCSVALATLLLVRAVDAAARQTPERAPEQAPGQAAERVPEGVRPAVPKGRWVAYGASLVLIGLCHIVALACLAGHTVLLLLHWRRTRSARALRWWAGSVVVALALLTPLLILGQSQVDGQLFWLKPPSLKHPTATLLQMLRPMFSSTGYLALFAVLSLCALLLWRRHRDALLFLVASVVLPIAAIFVISRVGSTSYWFGRYMLFTLPAWSVLTGAGLAAVARLAAGLLTAGQPAPGATPAAGRTGPAVRRRVFAAVTALGVAAAVLVGYSDQVAVRSYISHSWTNYPLDSAGDAWGYQPAAQFLLHRAKPGDGVYYGGSHLYMVGAGVEYYLRGRLPLNQFLTTESAADNGSYGPTLCPDLASCVAGAPDRVWLVMAPARPVPEDAKVQKALLDSGAYRISELYNVPGMSLYLLERKS